MAAALVVLPSSTTAAASGPVKAGVWVLGATTSGTLWHVPTLRCIPAYPHRSLGGHSLRVWFALLDRLTLPFLTRDLGNATANSMYWWGCSAAGIPGGYPTDACAKNDTYPPDTTIAYAKAAIQQTLARFGGDPSKVVVLGHSRGAIATQAIAGADATLAGLWAGAAAFSHYDGAETWPYSSWNGGMASAISRAHRLQTVPKFLCGECDVESKVAHDWLRDVARVDMRQVSALSTGFREHTGFWILRPSKARAMLRQWIARLLL